MEINLKTINEDDKKVYFNLHTFDDKEINISLDMDEYFKLNDVDIVDCAKIAYNNINTHPSNLMAETAVDLEGVLIYMGYWSNDGVIEIHDIRRLTQHEFDVFIEYRNEKMNLN